MLDGTLIDALDLQSSSSIADNSAMLIDAYLIQQRANHFRKGYRNWRQFGIINKKGNSEPASLKGAEGEMQDIASGLVTVHTTVDGAVPDPTGSLQLSNFRSSSMNLDSVQGTVSGASAAARRSSVACAPPLIGRHSTSQADLGASSANRLSRCNLQDGGASSENIVLKVSSSALRMSRAELHAEIQDSKKDMSQTEIDEALHPEHWTKFYITPFTERPVEARKILPVSDAMFHALGESKSAVKYPTYRRTADCWIVHLGVGGFHRSHQAMYTDLLLQHYKDHEQDDNEQPDEYFGFCGMGLMPWDSKMYQVMADQDNLYTVLFRSDLGTNAHIVGSIMDYMFAPDDHAACIEKLAHPDTRIVSLTVTEKGYCQNVQGTLDTNNPMVIHDLADLSQPQTALGMIVAGLKQRMEDQEESLTVLSCDNMPENGDTFKELLLEFAGLVDPALKDWIEENTPFPNTMVDRITPMTEEQHKLILREEFGIDDKWPVIAEHFGQWVVEDKFACGRPEWEKVGVLFTPDVKPYEHMKLRLLNGGHSALAYVSLLAGHIFVDCAMADEAVSGFVGSYLQAMRNCVPAVPGVNLVEYCEILNQRFSNPYIKDKLERLAEDGSKKLFNTMRGPILELTAGGHSTQGIAVAVAAYISFMSGTDLNGEPIVCIRDPMADALKAPCQEAIVSPYDPSKAIQIIFGDDIIQTPSFMKQVSEKLQSLKENGAVETMLAYIRAEPKTE